MSLCFHIAADKHKTKRTSPVAAEEANFKEDTEKANSKVDLPAIEEMATKVNRKVNRPVVEEMASKVNRKVNLPVVEDVDFKMDVPVAGKMNAKADHLYKAGGKVKFKSYHPAAGRLGPEPHHKQERVTPPWLNDGEWVCIVIPYLF